MTGIDPRLRPRTPSFSYFGAGLTILIALMIGGVLQEVRWRGGFAGIFSSPIETPSQQLKLAELAFGKGNTAAALLIFDQLAAKNDPVADYWLAHMIELGLGVPKNIPKAISLYEKAAAQDSLPAETRLGEIYLNGDLVPPDYSKAYTLLTKAAKKGAPRAAMLLSQMYRFGLGTPANPIESYAWSEVAVVEGLGFAKIERDAAFTSISPGDREKGAARSAEILQEIRSQPSPSKSP